MVSQSSGPAPEFIERQRERLRALHRELTGIELEIDEEEQDFETEYTSDTPDSGDEYQSLQAREADAGLHDEAERRLRDVRRALQKIDEGTYGLSDASGEPIAEGRLEAIPEAIYTVEEEKRREGG